MGALPSHRRGVSLRAGSLGDSSDASVASNACHPIRPRLASGPLACTWLLMGVAVPEASMCAGVPVASNRSRL